MNIAILTAGGIGSRMNSKIPKQFLTVNEVPIIVYTLRAFQNNKNIDKIVVACLKEWQPVLRAYQQEFNINKLEDIVEGGETGIGSIRNAFRSLKNLQDDDTILIHDGNRPLVNDKIIDSNIEIAQNNKIAMTYVDINDGVVKVDANNTIIDADINRNQIKKTQTPHTFSASIIKEIYDKIDDDNKYISVADAAAKLEYHIDLVSGSDINFKITTQDDLSLFKSFMEADEKNKNAK